LTRDYPGNWGYSDQGPTGAVEKYDPVSDIWTAHTPKTTPVYEIQATIISGKVYVPGGRLDEAHTSDLLEVYDPRQDAWSRGASLPEPRSAYGLINYEVRSSFLVGLMARVLGEGIHL